MICSKCSKAFDGAESCPNCGNDKNNIKQASSKNPKTSTITTIVILLIASVIGIVMYTQIQEASRPTGSWSSRVMVQGGWQNHTLRFSGNRITYSIDGVVQRQGSFAPTGPQNRSTKQFSITWNDGRVETLTFSTANRMITGPNNKNADRIAYRNIHFMRS
jgi:hypothetical protein